MAKLPFFFLNSSKNGLVAWGRKALLMQLFLFLFFNLLLKIFPAELCWISPIALCDGWCISGYGNFKLFSDFYFIFFPMGILRCFIPLFFLLFDFPPPRPMPLLSRPAPEAFFRRNNLFWFRGEQYVKHTFDGSSVNIILHLLVTLIGKIFTAHCRR